MIAVFFNSLWQVATSLFGDRMTEIAEEDLVLYEKH